MTQELPNALKIAQQLNLTTFDCPVVVVGGTNGKGSTVTLLEQFYLKAGFRVGAFRSPFFYTINEEICLNGAFIPDEALEVCLAKTQDALLSEFDHITLAALYYFKKKKPDVILLEVGLGGRLDPVNVVDSDISIITLIDYDHTEILGDTLEKIAYEKAGIIKPNKPIIFGGEDLALISTYVEEKKATLYAVGRDFEAKDRPSSTLHKNNIAMALKAIECLNNVLPVSDDVIEATIPTVFLTGRIELIHRNPTIIFDVAHNPSATKYLLEHVLKQSFKKTIAVFSMLKDKDIIGVVEVMKGAIDEWYLVPLKTERGASLDVLEKALVQCGITAYTKHDSITSAYAKGLDEVGEQDALVFFGSFHLARMGLK